MCGVGQEETSNTFQGASVCADLQQKEGRKKPMLPVQEQLRRLLCQQLAAVVSCRANGQTVGGQEHLALQFPSFSTSSIFPVASPVPPEELPPQQRPQQMGDAVLASFQATLREPLSALSLHIGVTHPGKTCKAAELLRSC